MLAVVGSRACRRVLVACCESGAVRVMDPRLSGRVALLRGHRMAEGCNIARFWDSHQFVTGACGRVAGAPLARARSASLGATVAVSPPPVRALVHRAFGGSRRVPGSDDCDARVWDLRKMATVTVFKGHTLPVKNVIPLSDVRRRDRGG